MSAANVRKHAIRWWGDAEDSYRPYCTRCGRYISHAVIRRRGDYVVSFDYHTADRNPRWVTA